ncbi:hypothetical protein BRC75_00325 [Halobacteriales archaeon QH_7_69_31]|nr:MAG: hypothetical protein BRC75_00325 [Halobacteriales archaeon QH_7_69_31]
MQRRGEPAGQRGAAADDVVGGGLQVVERAAGAGREGVDGGRQRVDVDVEALGHGLGGEFAVRDVLEERAGAVGVAVEVLEGGLAALVVVLGGGERVVDEVADVVAPEAQKRLAVVGAGGLADDVGEFHGVFVQRLGGEVELTAVGPEAVGGVDREAGEVDVLLQQPAERRAQPRRFAGRVALEVGAGRDTAGEHFGRPLDVGGGRLRVGVRIAGAFRLDRRLHLLLLRRRRFRCHFVLLRRGLCPVVGRRTACERRDRRRAARFQDRASVEPLGWSFTHTLT